MKKKLCQVIQAMTFLSPGSFSLIPKFPGSFRNINPLGETVGEQKSWAKFGPFGKRAKGGDVLCFVFKDNTSFVGHPLKCFVVF